MTSALALDRTCFARCIALANGKGGVGKTTTSAHFGAAAALGGNRVLIVDLDPQSNLEDSLGYDNPNRGKDLLTAVTLGVPAVVISNVRPRLDVIAGGEELEKLSDFIQSARMREEDDEDRGASMLLVAAAIAPIAADYDLILLDCPPANSGALQDSALAMAKYLLIPTKSDISSRKGIGVMARRFINMRRRVNPGLMLLGVLLFAFSSSASTVEDAARAWIEEALGAAAPVFKQKIRAVERQAFDTREQGLLSFEMSQDPKTTMGALAGDYHALSREVFVRLAELEAAA